MREIRKIRSVKIDGVETSLFTLGGYFHMIEHNEKNDKNFYKHIFFTTILPVLFTVSVLLIDYFVFHYLINNPPSVLNAFIGTFFGLFLGVQLVLLWLFLWDGVFDEFFANVRNLFTTKGRFYHYINIHNLSSLPDYIDKNFRNERNYYRRSNNGIREDDEIVEYFSKVDDETLVDFIKDCQTSEKLSHKITKVSKSITDPTIDRFIIEDLRELNDSLNEKLEEVDNRCKKFIENAKKEARVAKKNKSNSNALELLVS